MLHRLTLNSLLYFYSGNCGASYELVGEHSRHHGPLLPEDRRVAVVAAGLDAVGGGNLGGRQVQLRQPHSQAAGDAFDLIFSFQ